MGNHLSRRPGRISDDARGGGVATVLISCRCNPSLVCHRKASRHGVKVRHWDEETAPGAARVDPSGAGGRRKPIRSRSSRRAAEDPIGNLPEELLCMILSKLDTKQAARTSVLSSAWGHAWKLSPRLTFDIFAMSVDGYEYNSYKSCNGWREQLLHRQRCVQRFMDVVDAVLHQHLGGGAVVEQLELRLDAYAFAQVLHRLDEWVRFAVSSQARGVILHVPAPLTPLQAFCHETHVFPLQLLDAGGGTSSLQHVQLSSVLLQVPPHTQSVGFPNLRKLGLYSACVPTNDLKRVLSNCSSLEWLDLCMVFLKDGLRVDRPLPRLRYLRLADCRVTKIQLNASKLTSFVLKESQDCQVPTATSILKINLGTPEFLMPTSQLHSIHIHYHVLTLEHALGALPRAFPTVQRLSLHTHILPKFPWRPVNTSRFSRLRSLHLFFTITDQHAGSNILPIACILEAAPFLKELDAEFISFRYEFAGQGNLCEDPLSSFPHGQCKYKCLKTMIVHNFMGTKSQVELMEHIVENAPVLEVLTVDPRRRHVPGIGQINETVLSATRRIATISIGGKLSARTRLIVL